MEIESGLTFYCDSIKGPIKIIKTITRTNEVVVLFSNGDNNILPLTEVINNFKNKYYRLNSIAGLQATICDPAEIIIVRMALPGLRERIQGNIDTITVNTPGGDILLDHYQGYLNTIDTLIKRLNA